MQLHFVRKAYFLDHHRQFEQSFQPINTLVSKALLIVL
jgi:hypothetical protein